jgi:N utilization substance protein B
MANRHLSRSVVLQSLFEWDFSNRADASLDDILTRNINEFAPGASDFAFMRALFTSVVGKRRDLDSIIEKAAPEWPIDKISVVDRNILRLGLYVFAIAPRCRRRSLLMKLSSSRKRLAATPRAAL